MYLLSSVVLTIFALSNAVPTSAEETIVGGKTNSEGTIKFSSDDGDGGDGGEGGGIIDPVDPTNPDVEIPDGGGNGGGDIDGPLTIDFVSKIDFGKRKISGSTQVYHASYNEYLNEEGTTLYLPSFVQVTDDRGKNDGWKLEISNTQFKDAVTGDILEGAVLTLGAKNQVYTQNDNGSDHKVSAKGSIVLNGQGTDQTIVNPVQDKGMGTNTIAFGAQEYGTADAKNSSVTLEVPGKSKKNDQATYVSELTWTLSQTEI